MTTILKDDADIQAIIDSIPVTLFFHDDGNAMICNADGEAIFTSYTHREAEIAYNGMLTPEQREALRIDHEVTIELQVEAQGNRELSYMGG